MVFWGATRLPLIASRSVSGEVAQKLEDVAWHAKLKQQLASFQSEAKKNLKRDQNDSQTWKVEEKKIRKRRVAKSGSRSLRRNARRRENPVMRRPLGMKQRWSSISQVFFWKEELYGTDLLWKFETSLVVFLSPFPSFSPPHVNIIESLQALTNRARKEHDKALRLRQLQRYGDSGDSDLFRGRFDNGKTDKKDRRVSVSSTKASTGIGAASNAEVEGEEGMKEFLNPELKLFFANGADANLFVKVLIADGIASHIIYVHSGVDLCRFTLWNFCSMSHAFLFYVSLANWFVG